MTKTILVFGASGIVGQGAAKASLEKGYRVVGVFRSTESAEKTRARFGNPAQDKFITVVGSLASEESAAELQKSVLAKAGEITDVVASLGSWARTGPLFDLKADELDKYVGHNKLVPHFLAAKYFLPLLNKEGTSYTIINGALGVTFPYVPTVGRQIIENGSLNKLSTVVINESTAPTRINEFVITTFTKHWDDTRPDTEIFPLAKVLPDFPPSVTNIKLGNAIVGIITHPNSKGESIIVTGDSLDQLSTTGKVESKATK